MTTCARCVLPILASEDPLPLEHQEVFAREAHEGASRTRCPACGQDFLRLWREVGGWDIEDIWVYWVPITTAEIAQLRAASDPLKQASTLVMSRTRLVRMPSGTLHVSSESREIGIWMHT
ncbi:MAG: hypothetical protein AAFV53_31840 [Myxococcota bacterium]